MENPYESKGDGSTEDQTSSLGGPTFVRHRIVAAAVASSVLLYLDRVCISIAQNDIQQDLGLSDKQIAWILGAFFWSYAIAQVPAGWLSDQFGRRAMMVIYIASWSLFTALTGLASGFVMLFLLRLAFGVAQAGAYPTSGALVGRWIPVAGRGRASSLVAFGGRVGGAAAPFLTGLLIGLVGHLTADLVPADAVGPLGYLGDWLRHGWRVVMVLYGALGILVAALFWGVVRNDPAEHRGVNTAELQLIRPPRASAIQAPASGSQGSELAGMLGRLVTSPSMWLMCVAQFSTNVGWVFLVTTLPKYLRELQVKESDVGMLSSIPLFVGMGGMLLGGVVVDMTRRAWGLRWGTCLPLAMSRWLAALAFLACFNAPSPAVATAAFAMVAFFTDLGVASSWAYMQDVGGRKVGAVLGWGNMWGNFGAGASPPLLEWVSRTYDTNKDWNEPFLVCVLAFVISGVVSLGIDATKHIEVYEG